MNDDPKIHIMFDCETLGLGPTPVVMTIGAVAFDHNGPTMDPGFHIALSWQEQIDKGRKIDADTLAWWFRPDMAGARQCVLEMEQQSITSTVYALEAWIDRVLNGYREPAPWVWAKGPQQDLVWLKTLFGDPPWSYQDERDLRTGQALTGCEPGKRETTEHHALNDAIEQAHHAAAILRAARVGKCTR